MIKGTLSNLKLSAVEYCVLSDMRRVIDRFANNNFLVHQSDDSNSLVHQSDDSNFLVHQSDDSNSLVHQSDDSNFLWPLFEDYDENDFDKFFTRLGSNRAKELLNLFVKLKMRVSNSVFETEIFFLYMCIKDASLVNLLYLDYDERNCFDDDNEHNCFDFATPTLNSVYKKIKWALEFKLKDFGVFI